jgi:hypothetical protein
MMKAIQAPVELLGLLGAAMQGSPGRRKYMNNYLPERLCWKAKAWNLAT